MNNKRGDEQLKIKIDSVKNSKCIVGSPIDVFIVNIMLVGNYEKNH